MIVLQPLARDYTTIPNDLLRDPALSMDAKCVQAWLLSLPRDWTVRIEQLRKHWGCGLERMKRIMRELIAAGWVQRRPPRKRPDGSFTPGDYIAFNTRQPVQAPLALDEAAAGDAATLGTGPAGARNRRAQTQRPKLDAPESVEPESVGPESDLRTPYQELIPPRTVGDPPNPPVPGGTSTVSQRVSQERNRVEGGPGLGTGAKGLGAGRWRRTAATEAAAALDPDAAERFRRLLEAYPEGALRSRERDARAVFAVLTAGEQAAAILRARSYADSLRRKPGHPFALQTWLRQTDFRALAERLAAGPAPSTPAAAPPPAPEPPAARPPAADPSAEAWAMVERGDWPRGGTVFVAADSPEGAAWTAHFARFERRPLWMTVPGKGRGWLMPGLWPPTAEAA